MPLLKFGGMGPAPVRSWALCGRPHVCALVAGGAWAAALGPCGLHAWGACPAGCVAGEL